jgi:hypothetical protein
MARGEKAMYSSRLQHNLLVSCGGSPPIGLGDDEFDADEDGVEVREACGIGRDSECHDSAIVESLGDCLLDGVACLIFQLGNSALIVAQARYTFHGSTRFVFFFVALARFSCPLAGLTGFGRCVLGRWDFGDLLFFTLFFTLFASDLGSLTSAALLSPKSLG